MRADERTRGTPIILLSARAGDESTVEGLRSGADDHLVKPFSARELLARVRTQLEMTRIRRELNERALVEQRLRETLKARDEWLTVVSHELRTPVTALTLSLQSLLRRIPAAAGTRKVQATVKNLDRLLQHVEHLIDVADLASGHPLELSAMELDLSALTADVISDTGEKATRAGCALRLDAPAPVIGVYDRSRLRQLLQQLLDNATKFGSDKPIELSVRQETEHDPVRNVIRVVDHGRGIATEDVERVFRRFERAAPTHTYGGFGLGLWIARHIASAHAGSIELSPTEGGGTSVIVTLQGSPRPDGEGA